jgi:N-acetyl sugar amidotransferase
MLHNFENYQICTKTIMENVADPTISFDAEGICNYAYEYQTLLGIRVPKNAVLAKQKLDEAVKNIKDAGKGKDYDCIIGVSGGVDSTYLAYYTKNILGLRPLAIHLDNGWNSELAVSNIEKTLNFLDIDLYTHVLDWEEFKTLQLAFLKASTPDGEIPTDHAITAILYQMADKYGIKYIISGTNVKTEGIMPRIWSDGHLDWKYLSTINKLFGTKPLKTYPHLSLLSYFKHILFKGIKKIAILDFIEYDKTNTLALLEKELGWRNYGGKHYESIYTRFFQGYILFKKFGIDKRRGHLSTLICSGLITREIALEEIKNNPYPSEQMFREDYEYVLKKLNLSETEFEEIMNLPHKNYHDYPNSDKTLQYLWNWYDFFRKRSING